MAYDTETEPADRKGICSVVIPAFNEEQALQNTLPEVIAFCEKLNWPLIILDDGSTDGTDDVVKKWAEQNEEKDALSLLYFYQVNAGPGAARNRGIKEISGEYVQFLDSDDLIHPERLQRLTETFEREQLGL